MYQILQKAPRFHDTVVWKNKYHELTKMKALDMFLVSSVILSGSFYSLSVHMECSAQAFSTRLGDFLIGLGKD